MEVVRKIVSADVLTPIIDLPWPSNGLEVEVIVFPINKVYPSNVKTKNSDVDISFGGWSDMGKTTEIICSEIRESRKFRNRNLDLV